MDFFFVFICCFRIIFSFILISFIIFHIFKCIVFIIIIFLLLEIWEEPLVL